MAIHHKDKKRKSNKPYRLLGVNLLGRPYFFWSDEPGQFAAYIGKSSPYGVWGTLDCTSGKRMHPENRVFIANHETARQLEEIGVVQPCGRCNRVEYKRYKSEGRLSVNRHIEID
jgi:hypothetical protein